MTRMRSQPFACSALSRSRDRRLAVAHRPVDFDLRTKIAQRLPSFSLCERVIVFSGPSSRFLVPDRGVVAAPWRAGGAAG